MDVGYIKCLSRGAGICEIVQKGEWIEFVSKGGVSAERAVELLNEYRGKIRLGTGETPSLRYRFERPLTDNIKIILQKLAK